jgi:hypothetical protein
MAAAIPVELRWAGATLLADSAGGEVYHMMARGNERHEIFREAGVGSDSSTR